MKIVFWLQVFVFSSAPMIAASRPGEFVPNYDMCQLIFQKMLRNRGTHAQEVELARHLQKKVKAPNEEEEAPPSPGDPWSPRADAFRELNPKDAVSIQFDHRSGTDFGRLTSIRKGHPVYGDRGHKTQLYSVEPVPLEVRKFGVAENDFYGLRDAPGSQYRDWLGGGLDALKAAVQDPAAAASRETQVLAVDMPTSDIRSAAKSLRGDSYENSTLPPQSFYLNRYSVDSSVWAVAFSASTRIALGMSAYAAFQNAADVSWTQAWPAYVTAPLILFPPYYLTRRLGFSLWNHKPVELRLLKDTHDADKWLEVDAPGRLSLRTGDGLNLFIDRSKSDTRFYAWFPKGSKYEQMLAEDDRRKLGSNATKAAVAPEPDYPLKQEPEASQIDEKRSGDPIDTFSKYQDIRGEALRALSLKALEKLPKRIKPQPDSKTIQSARAVQALVESLGSQVLERGPMIDAAVLALIAREHLMVVGPSGNGKTTTLGALMRAFQSEDQPSFKKIQLKHDMGDGELFGPFSTRKLLGEDKYERLHQEGFLQYRHVILDEIMDLRPSMRRDLLEALEERGYGDHQGQLESVIGITNKFVPDVLQTPNGQLDDTARALLDRFALFFFQDWDFQKGSSEVNLFNRKRQKIELPIVSFQDKERLMALARELKHPTSLAVANALVWEKGREKMEAQENQAIRDWQQAMMEGRVVDPPRRTTRVFSPRGKEMAGVTMAASEVQAWMKRGAEGVPTTSLDSMRYFERAITMMDGNGAGLLRRREVTSNPAERVQIESILEDRRIAQDEIADLQMALERSPLLNRLKELEALSASEAKERALLELIDEIEAAVPDLDAGPITQLNYSHVAALKAKEDAAEQLRSVTEQLQP